MGEADLSDRVQELVVELGSDRKSSWDARVALTEVIRWGSEAEAAVVRDELSRLADERALTRIELGLLTMARRRLHDPDVPPRPMMIGLPIAPAFPVYGLPPGFTGPRRLDLWNLVGGGTDIERARRNGYEHISLDHGPSPTSAYDHPRRCKVVTMPRQLKRVSPTTGEAEVRPDSEAVQDVALRALLTLVNRVQPQPRDRDARLAWLSRQRDEAVRLSQDLTAEPWQREPGHIDDSEAAFTVRIHGSDWTAFAITNEVRIIVTAVDLPLADLRIVEVDLADYEHKPRGESTRQ